jgi:hypothetical protein
MMSLLISLFLFQFSSSLVSSHSVVFSSTFQFFSFSINPSYFVELPLPAARSTQLSLILAASCLICFSSSPFSIYSPFDFLKPSTFIAGYFASELQLALLSPPLTYIALASLCLLSKAAEYHPKYNPAQYYQLPSKTQAHPTPKSIHSDLPSPKNPSHPY